MPNPSLLSTDALMLAAGWKPFSCWNPPSGECWFAVRKQDEPEWTVALAEAQPQEGDWPRFFLPYRPLQAALDLPEIDLEAGDTVEWYKPFEFPAEPSYEGGPGWCHFDEAETLDDVFWVVSEAYDWDGQACSPNLNSPDLVVSLCEICTRLLPGVPNFYYCMPLEIDCYALGAIDPDILMFFRPVQRPYLPNAARCGE